MTWINIDPDLLGFLVVISGVGGGGGGFVVGRIIGQHPGPEK